VRPWRRRERPGGYFFRFDAFLEPRAAFFAAFFLPAFLPALRPAFLRAVFFFAALALVFLEALAFFAVFFRAAGFRADFFARVFFAPAFLGLGAPPPAEPLPAGLSAGDGVAGSIGASGSKGVPAGVLSSISSTSQEQDAASTRFVPALPLGKSWV
jgi:hypothetical protein